MPGKMLGCVLALLVMTGGLFCLNISGSSEAQVATDYLAYWGFNEGNGAQATDSSDNQYNGNINGAVWTDGVSGAALDFDGTDDYVGIRISNSLDNLIALTYEAWITPRADSHWHVMSKGDGSKRLYSEASGSTLDLTGRVRCSQTHAYSTSIDNTVVLNTWQHVAMTWSSGTSALKVYRNGVEVSYSYMTVGSGTPETDITCPYTIGARGDLVAGTFFDGIIDEVYLWGRALTQSELRSHYVAMVLPSAPGNLLATPGNTQATLSWVAPTSAGTSTITHYEIYRGTYQGGEAFLAETGNPLTYTNTGLTNGQTYYYKVAAKNANGTGFNSTEVNVTPRTVPSEPQDIYGSAGDGYVYLSWSPPASDGGSAITVYTVYRGTAIGGETQLVSLGNVLNYNDTAVENGHTYFYAVVAANAAGDGAPSAEAGAIPSQAADSGIGGGALPGDILLVLFIIITVVLLLVILYLSDKLRKKPVIREFAPQPNP